MYQFLEDLGCRWFASDVSVVPTLGRIELPRIRKTGRPAFEFRDHFSFDAWDPQWSVRNRFNGNFTSAPSYMGGHDSYGLFVHTFYALLPPEEFFDQHPEYFSMVDGVRRRQTAQICLTNPDVLRIVTQRVLERMRSNPQAKIFSVSQNDFQGYCTCEQCNRVAENEGSQAGPVLHFVNAIAEQTSKEFPDKLIDTLAYEYTLKAPRHVRPGPNVRVRLCSIRCCQGHGYGTCDHPGSVEFLEALRDWSKITNQMYIWHYCTNFAHYHAPMADLDELHANINLYRKNGVHGLFMQGCGENGGGAESAALRAYLAGQAAYRRGRWEEAVNDLDRLGTLVEQGLPLRHPDVDVPGHQVGKSARLLDAAQHLLDHLVGETGLLAQLRGALPRLAVEADEGRVVGVEGLHLLGLADDRLEIAGLVAHVHHDSATLAVQQQLHAGQPALDLPDPGDRPDRVEAFGGDLLDVLALADGEDEPLRCGERGLDRAHRARPPGPEGGRHAGEEHHFAKRKHRERQSLGHSIHSFFRRPRAQPPRLGARRIALVVQARCRAR